MRFATQILIAAIFIPRLASRGNRQLDDSQSQPDKLPSESDKYSAQFLLGIAPGHFRIAFAVFPDERKQPNDQGAK